MLFIRELRIDTEIGVYEWEHNIKQPITLDIEMSTDISEAAKHDSIKYAIDYKSIVDRVTEYVTSKHFKLVETVAEGVAELIQTEFGIEWIRLRVSKLHAIKPARDVGIIIERGTKK